MTKSCLGMVFYAGFTLIWSFHWFFYLHALWHLLEQQRWQTVYTMLTDWIGILLALYALHGYAWLLLPWLAVLMLAPETYQPFNSVEAFQLWGQVTWVFSSVVYILCKQSWLHIGLFWDLLNNLKLGLDPSLQ